MLHTRTFVVGIALVGLILGACGDDSSAPQAPATTVATSDSMTDDSMTDDSMTDDSMTDDSMMDNAEDTSTTMP